MVIAPVLGRASECWFVQRSMARGQLVDGVVNICPVSRTDHS